MQRWYQSKTMGNIVEHWWQVLAQMVESPLRFRRWDFRWRIVWM